MTQIKTGSIVKFKGKIFDITKGDHYGITGLSSVWEEEMPFVVKDIEESFNNNVRYHCHLRKLNGDALCPSDWWYLIDWLIPQGGKREEVE